MSAEGIEYVLVAVGTPRVNGQVERFDRVIVPAVAELSENQKIGTVNLGA